MTPAETAGLIALAALPAQPWKNGGGTTTQIAIEPPDAGMDTFAWRISRARIERDGPFSSFPHVTRWIMLLEGNGFELGFPGGRSLVVNRPFVPHRFDGGLRTACRLLDGPCTDLNVMAHRALSIAVTVIPPGSDAPPEGHALRRDDGMTIRLGPDHVLRVTVSS